MWFAKFQPDPAGFCSHILKLSNSQYSYRLRSVSGWTGRLPCVDLVERDINFCRVPDLFSPVVVAGRLEVGCCSNSTRMLRGAYVVALAMLVAIVRGMALPGAKVDTDIHLLMPGVQPQTVSR